MMTDGTARGLIVMIPGSGGTDFVEGDQFLTEREFLVAQSFAVAYWDKAGNGLSEGEFDYNQSVESSAKEALAALVALKGLDLPNADNLGVWGISRAGWIVPKMTELTDAIRFWISVSGASVLADDRYRLEANLKAMGRGPEETATLVAQWEEYQRILVKGGTLEEFNAKTGKLMADPYYNSNNFVMTQENLQGIQGFFQSGAMVFDEETNLAVMYPKMKEALRSLSIPVLALSGRVDTLVDWRAAQALYDRAAQDGLMQLTSVVLPGCNHSMQQSVTGSEAENLPPGTPLCAGYLETMETWLESLPS